MFKILLLASLAVAVFFIINSAFRRRLMWSIRVTLGFYAAVTVLRIVVVGIYKIFQPGPDEGQLFLALVGIGLVSAIIWVAFRYYTERYLRRSRNRPAEARRGKRR
jgi:hypothetical protein